MSYSWDINTTNFRRELSQVSSSHFCLWFVTASAQALGKALNLHCRSQEPQKFQMNPNEKNEIHQSFLGRVYLFVNYHGVGKNNV